MKNKTHLIRFMLPLILMACLALGMTSCGTTSAYMGLNHEISYDWDGYDNGYHYGHYKKHKKHKKYKKYKKYKGKKHHHHHDDDDD